MMNNRSIEDEEMIKAIGTTAQCEKSMISSSKVMIYDARPYLNAQANRLKSGGFESTKYYKNADIEFCDIDNIFERAANFQVAVEKSGYYLLISRILRAANNMVDKLLNKRINVLVHCSDGWDRTA
jgi:protein tyrosine/serine phosphatase